MAGIEGVRPLGAPLQQPGSGVGSGRGQADRVGCVQKGQAAASRTAWPWPGATPAGERHGPPARSPGPHPAAHHHSAAAAAAAATPLHPPDADGAGGGGPAGVVGPPQPTHPPWCSSSGTTPLHSPDSDGVGGGGLAGVVGQVAHGADVVPGGWLQVVQEHLPRGGRGGWGGVGALMLYQVAGCRSYRSTGQGRAGEGGVGQEAGRGGT